MKVKLLVTLIFGMALLSACTTQQARFVHHHKLVTQGAKAITVCVGKIKRVTGTSLSSEADRAYVFIHDDWEWISVIFAHGALGTFERRGNYYMVIGCDVTKESPMKVITLGRPLRYPIFIAPAAKNFYGRGRSTFANSMELWYSREQGRFQFQAMQRFSVKRFLKHNPKLFEKPKCNLNPKAPPPETPPTPAWIKKHPGCYLKIED
ncbi:MAG: hypothetical protein ACRD22_13070 [Terriglobia bacterium]